MSNELDNLVIYKSPEPSVKWIPEDYGFKSDTERIKKVWYKNNLELRCLDYDYWLCRKKVKNKKGNTELLICWRIKIESDDKEFADLIFSKGLK